jgi:hypothetical protein
MPGEYFKKILSIIDGLNAKAVIWSILFVDHMLSNSQAGICQMANLEAAKRGAVSASRNRISA